MSPIRTPVLYLAPWVDFGGSDKGTIDWFKWLDRSRFAPSLITTQPSPNRRLSEVEPFADEVWALPELFAGAQHAEFIVDFVVSRRVPLIHVMNSRLGYDLLPDLRSLDHRPRIVVQLHVEEHTRDGYVRYVTTRYGNLVDAFSVTSEHLADAVEGYGVSRDRIEVIHTGVDAETEFSPDVVAPRPGVSGRGTQILYPGRLVEQKDPLLMVAVAAELARRGLDFQLHVVGSGELESEVRRLVAEHRLGDRVRFEPPTNDLAPWYAACDLLLMTSLFEGVPYVVYEALAMGVPVVAPALAGNRELMGDIGGTLVAERSIEAFAEALEPLIVDGPLRERVGADGRRLMLERYSLRTMADGHGELYDRLAGDLAIDGPSPPPWFPTPISFSSRPSRGTPMVSVITPCFNHGRWLHEAVESVLAQSYPAIEMIVVDDGSTESETRQALDELGRGGQVRVLRMERNSGPSAARNRAIEHAEGRYVLPLDADNLLLPDAVARLVSQLQGAGEHIGYVYPTIQYFGNREDYFEPPRFNGWVLTRGNYIDTCALIDRMVFDAGIRYPDEIVLGHEDWDFFLTLLEHGVHGEPARGKTLRYRKHGFTRSDVVDWSLGIFHGSVPARHPKLFPGGLPTDTRGNNPQVVLKARWAPALTVIALGTLQRDSPLLGKVMRGVEKQNLRDFELYVATPTEPLAGAGAPPVHQLPPRLVARPAEAIAYALERTAAPHVAITYGTGAELLSDPGSLERLVRLLEQGTPSGIIGLADAGRTGGHAWALLGGDDPGLELHTLAWSRRHKPLRELPDALDEDDPIADLGRWYQLRRISIDWRHLPLVGPLSSRTPGHRRPSAKFPRSRPELSDRHSRVDAETSLPGPLRGVKRWEMLSDWAPPGTVALMRHRRAEIDDWTVSTSYFPPEGYERDRCLGLLHWMAFEGTARIIEDADQGWRTVPRGGQPDAVELESTLGYADQVAFPLLEPLMLCRHARTGANVMICGEDDPLRSEVEWPQLAVLGWIDRWPVNPRTVPRTGETTAWLRGLVRSVDYGARRHRVGVGADPGGERRWELGALLDRDPGSGIPAWTDDAGRLHTGGYAATDFPFSVRRTLKWVAAPAAWSGFGRRVPRVRAVARRAAEAPVRAIRSVTGGSAADTTARIPQGWLLPEDGPHRVPIYSALHAATSDQLVTRDPSEARDLGYESLRMLGYALAVAPITGTLARPDVGIPWGSHFGQALSRSEDRLLHHP